MYAGVRVSSLKPGVSGHPEGRASAQRDTMHGMAASAQRGMLPCRSHSTRHGC